LKPSHSGTAEEEVSLLFWFETLSFVMLIYGISDRPLPKAMISLLNFLFAQFPCKSQILIIKILNAFLWLKFSAFLNLNKNEHFSKVSLR